MTAGDRRGEGGVAVVMVTGMVAVLVLVALVAGGLVAVVAAHRTVQGAADLAALAGATTLRAGSEACTVVEEIAAAHRTEVQECNVEGAVVDVVLSVDLSVGPGSWTLSGRARAGPGGTPG